MSGSEYFFPKGEKELIQQAAKQAGQSVNAYVYEAVRRRIEQEATETGTPGGVENSEDGSDSVE